MMIFLFVEFSLKRTSWWIYFLVNWHAIFSNWTTWKSENIYVILFPRLHSNYNWHGFYRVENKKKILCDFHDEQNSRLLFIACSIPVIHLNKLFVFLKTTTEPKGYSHYPTYSISDPSTKHTIWFDMYYV